MHEITKHILSFYYSRIPPIRKMVIRNANYPDWHGPSCKHLRIIAVLHLFMT